MPEISQALSVVSFCLGGVVVMLGIINAALWASVAEQRKTNALSERMAKILESE